MLSDPGVGEYFCRIYRFTHYCFQDHVCPKPTHRSKLTGLNHFSLATYGLQFPLPTLNHVHYYTQPKAKYEMRSVALFRWHFQPLAVVHFRGAHMGFFGLMAWLIRHDCGWGHHKKYILRYMIVHDLVAAL